VLYLVKAETRKSTRRNADRQDAELARFVLPLIKLRRVEVWIRILGFTR
jgi:hypothetical protein